MDIIISISLKIHLQSLQNYWANREILFKVYSSMPRVRSILALAKVLKKVCKSVLR